jgi:acetolactate synthase I/II/III large subunit
VSLRLDLQKAQRPAILVGGGAYRAREKIVEFATDLSIPCFRTWNALDVIPDNATSYAGTVGTYGGPGRNFGIQNCDLLLVLGCRLSGRITGGLPETFARGARRYIIDVDDAALDPLLQQVKAHVNIRRDVGEWLADVMAENLSYLNFGDWLAQCRVWLNKYDPVKPEHLTGPFHHYGFMRRLSTVLPDNAVVISDTGGNQIMMGHCFRSKRGQRIFSSNGNSPMGFSMCGAMGAWCADPTRPIIAVIGDGGFCFNTQELTTLRNYKIPVKVVIVNNKILGNTKSYQRVNGMAEVACGPDGYRPPDFEKVVRAYGIEYRRVDSWQTAETALVEMLYTDWTRDEPFVIDAIHDDFCRYEPRVSAWNVGIEDAYPFLPRDEFRANIIGIEPLPGWENNK